MRRLLLAVAAILLLLSPLACSDPTEPPEETEPPVVTDTTLRVRAVTIVSGDRQVAPVRDPAVSRGMVSALDVPLNVLPEPLRARIGMDTIVDTISVAGARLASGLRFGITGGTNIVAEWRIRPEPAGCGAPFISSTAPDTAMEVVTFWEKGTKAGVDCQMELRVIENGVPRIDTVFHATFLPGPVAGAYAEAPSTWGRLPVGDTIDVRDIVTAVGDAYGNSIPLDSIADDEWAWAWSSAVAGDPKNVMPAAPEGTGRYITLIDPSARDYVVGRVTGTDDDGNPVVVYYYPTFVYVWVRGIRANNRARINILAP